jgi:hypothetical protein
MRRFLTAALLTVTVLALSALPALATPISELTDLARFFPAQTPIFASARIDDAFFETLDGVVAKVGAALPAGAIPPMTIVQALDMALADATPPMQFQADIRPWLGDTFAFGINEIPMNSSGMDLANDGVFMIAVAITDRAAATAWLTGTLDANNEGYTRTDEADYTIIVPADADAEAAVVIRDGVLLLTNQSALATRLPDGSLASSATFTDAFSRLPETDYNAAVYLNLPTVLEAAAASDPEAAQVMGVLGGVMSALGPQAWGFTIIDGVSLTMDAVQVLGDLSAIEALGLPTTPPAPLNPQFAAHIPAGAPLVILGTDLNRSFAGALTGFEAQMNLMAEAGLGDAADMQEFEQGIAQIESAFTMFTGLDLREDVFGWMTGNYGLFMMINPKLNLSSPFGIFQAFPVDFGLAVEVTDPQAAVAMVEGLTKGLEQLGEMAASQSNNETEVAITSETIVGANVTVVTITIPDAPWPVELVMGANGEVFALGTRSAVTAMFARDGGLPSNAAYTRALGYALDNPVSLAYLGTEGLLPLADLITTFADEDDAEAQANADILRQVLNLIPSGTVSQAYSADGTSALTRLTLTLAD